MTGPWDWDLFDEDGEHDDLDCAPGHRDAQRAATDIARLIRAVAARSAFPASFAPFSPFAHSADSRSSAEVGAASPTRVRQTLSRAFGPDLAWIAPLVAHLEVSGWLGRLEDEAALSAAVFGFEPFRKSFSGIGQDPRSRLWLPLHPRAGRPAPPLDWLTLPALHTVGALAEWLGLSISELDWFADLQGRNGSMPPGDVAAALPRGGGNGHYSYRWQPKRRGGYRLLEAPKRRLRAMQRRILREILAPVPVHHAAHGSVAGRSIVTQALAHCERALLLRLDIRDFFASIHGGRVRAVFAALGYPPAVAAVLAALTTHRAPAWVVRSLPFAEGTPPDRRLRQLDDMRLYQRIHLPQGAPTSPALANLCAFRLDHRLAAAARSCGASYTRYVDDLHFSGDAGLASRSEAFRRMAAAIVAEEGWLPNERKTRLMPASRAQIAAGVVVNHRPNVQRKAYDQLKAILHNCARYGPSSQYRDGVGDFRAHLSGRVAHVVHLNPIRGARLLKMFERVAWDA